MPKPFTLDINAIPLGEMMDVELASGRNFGDLVRSRTGLLMIGLYLRALRQRAPGTPPPSWDEIASLTPSAALRYASPDSQDSDLTTSDS